MPRERSGDSAQRQADQQNHATPAARGLSIAELRQIITLMQHSDIDEVTVEREADGLRLQLRKPSPVAEDFATVPGSAPHFEHQAVDHLDGAAAVSAEDHALRVTAPLVGRFHVALSPGGKPMVAAGDIVRQGQIVGAIETLNVFNEVEADHPGRVSAILVAEGQAVEYGQALMSLDPLTP
jgi:acetyl-CoA carboxylase biotin carboxyl carrier protein